MDFSDAATRQEELMREVALQVAMRKAADIQAGNPGECDLCGEFSSRLVDGACCPCRDKWGIK